MATFSIEEIIRQAIQEGKFDDLPGKGRPLKIEHHPHQDPDWRAAHHLLKSSGFSLPWIEHLREIHSNLQQSRESLIRAWAWGQSEHHHYSQEDFVKREWISSVAIFQDQIQSINDQIRTYNLEVPNPRFQILLVYIHLELDLVMC